MSLTEHRRGTFYLKSTHIGAKITENSALQLLQHLVSYTESLLDKFPGGEHEES